MNELELPTFDLGPIKYQLMRNADGEAWNPEKCERIEVEYRRYLALCKNHPEQVIVPSKSVDQFWHVHILDTLKYHQDCDHYFGFYLHHFPYFGMRGDADKKALAESFAASQTLYQDAFGDLPASEQPTDCGDYVVKPTKAQNILQPDHRPAIDK